MPDRRETARNTKGGRRHVWGVVVSGVAVLLLLGIFRELARSAPRSIAEESGAVSASAEDLPPEAEGWPRRIAERRRDGSTRRIVEIPAPPQRIVSVTLGTDEMLLDLVDKKRIAALSYLAPREGSPVADRVSGIPAFVGDDVERIIALDPDLCFLASYNRAETRTTLEESGIPILVFSCFDSIEDVQRNLFDMGRALGADAEARQIVERMRRRLERIASRLPPREEWPTVLLYGPDGWVAGRGTLHDDLLGAAGARNAAAEAGIEGFGRISEERVIAMDPDWLLVEEGPGGIPHHREWLERNPVLSVLQAVRNRRYVSVQAHRLSSVSHHVVDAVESIARQIHPARMKTDEKDP